MELEDAWISKKYRRRNTLSEGHHHKFAKII